MRLGSSEDTDDLLADVERALATTHDNLVSPRIGVWR